jgi:hypothetical protein
MKIRIVSLLFALASFVLWSTAGLSEMIVPIVSDGGTFRVPVTINGQLTLEFVIDSGAADVSVPADVVMTLLRTGTITDTDFLGKQTYKLADGSTVPSQQFVIRTLKVGDKTLENIVGSIAPVTGSLLLGQSFLRRFNTWSIDNQRQALILGSPPNNNTELSSAEVPDERVYKPVAPYKPLPPSTAPASPASSPKPPVVRAAKPPATPARRVVKRTNPNPPETADRAAPQPPPPFLGGSPAWRRRAGLPELPTDPGLGGRPPGFWTGSSGGLFLGGH